MLWAASQAAPLRRLHVDRSLLLWQLAWNATSDTPWAALVAGFASGGFVADSSVDGDVWLQSQQQYFLRNTALRGSALRPAAWSTVLVGCTGDGRPARSTCADANATSVVDATRSSPRSRTLRSAAATTAASSCACRRSNARASVPRRTATATTSSASSTCSSPAPTSTPRRASTRSSAPPTVVRAVVLSPGVYRLGAPLRVARTNVTLLGLGFATLVATNGTAAVEVDGGVSGVRIAGLLLEAGQLHSAALLHVQAGAPPPADAAGSVVLSDVFVRARAGRRGARGHDGADTPQAPLVDNMWLWRADHEADPAYYGGGGGAAATNASIRDRDGRLTGVRFVDGGGASARTCEHGLVVGESAANVTAYGLAVEHALGDQVVWKGDGGRSIPGTSTRASCVYDVTRDAPARAPQPPAPTRSRATALPIA